MKQFNLNEWLENRSRKVVTRDSRNVRIVCWDAPEHIPYIYGFIEGDNGITNWHKDGMWASKKSICDLFFADDEDEKLTEFEKEIAKIIGYNTVDMSNFTITLVKSKSKQILDLIRNNEDDHVSKDKYYKDTEKAYREGISSVMGRLPSGYDSSLNGLEKELDQFFINRLNAYLRGASKEELDNQIETHSTRWKNLIKNDLPKWHKANGLEEFDKHIVILDEDNVYLDDETYPGDYYIELSELTKLPKEK